MKNAIILMTALAGGVAALLAVGNDEQGPPRSVPTSVSPPAETAPATALAAESHADATSRPETETVLGLSVRKDRRCRVELRDYVTPAGEMFSAFSCSPRAARQPHPYAHYDDGSLEILAWSDAEAAALLGRRLTGADRDKAYEMLVRATALDGDTTHLAWLADQAFSAIRIDGDLNVFNVERRYELAELASRLGGDPTTSRYLRSLLVDAGLSDARLEALDSRVVTLLDSVRDIQRAVHGKARHGGQKDA
jgi:hypothetical protein